jgi:hypothetical protein
MPLAYEIAETIPAVLSGSLLFLLAFVSGPESARKDSKPGVQEPPPSRRAP